MDPGLHRLAEGNPDDEVAAIIRTTDSHGPFPENVRIVVEFGPIATCRLRREDIVATRLADGVESIKAPVRLMPELAIDEGDFNEPPLDTDNRRPAGAKATGKGTVVGIIDWGCDIAHADFRRDDGTTRFLAIWDQCNRGRERKTPGSTPNPYGYGRIFTQAEIDSALRYGDPYGILGYHPEDGDPDKVGSHGTHVLSIAAGNGRAGGPHGIAPNADLVFVHFGSHDGNSIGDSVSLLEGLHFIAQTAATRPVVINLSLGRHGGPHDGTTLVEQAIEYFINAGPCRAVVQSAGNYFAKNIHCEGRIGPHQHMELEWEVDPADTTPNELDLWYSRRDRLRCEIVSSRNETLAKSRLETQANLIRQGERCGAVYHRRGDPNNGDNQITVYLDRTAPAGTWKVRLIAEEIVDGRFHAWVERDLACPGCQSRFVRATTPTTTTGTICNGLRSITVGAYNPHDGAHPLAPFSSSGPTRDGRIKPDLVAPGVRVLAARSASRQPGCPALCRKSGTSMAAPHVSGIIACLFEAAGTPLSINETRRIILGSADTRNLDNDDGMRLGNGFLNCAKALEMALPVSTGETTAAQMAAHEQIAVNSSSESATEGIQIEAVNLNIREWQEGAVTAIPIPLTRWPAAHVYDSLTIGTQPKIAQAVLESFDVIGLPGTLTDNGVSSADIMIRRGEGGLATLHHLHDVMILERIPRDAIVLRPKAKLTTTPSQTSYPHRNVSKAHSDLPNLNPWKTVLSFRPTAAVQQRVKARGTHWEVHRIENAAGDLNLDVYAVEIHRLPMLQGRRLGSSELVEHVRRHINDFIDTAICDFRPFDAAEEILWKTMNPTGAIISIEMKTLRVGVDTGCVVTTKMSDNEWIFSTIKAGSPRDAFGTPLAASHPVSGNRAFGIYRASHDRFVFYTVGADRPTRRVDDIFDRLVFYAADQLWRSLQHKLLIFVNSHAGIAQSGKAEARRFNWKTILASPYYDVSNQPRWE